MESENQRMQRLGQALVERGFARSYIHHDRRELSQIEWTPAGEIMRELLRELFDIPNVAAQNVDPQDALTLIALFNFFEPSK